MSTNPSPVPASILTQISDCAFPDGLVPIPEKGVPFGLANEKRVFHSKLTVDIMRLEGAGNVSARLRHTGAQFRGGTLLEHIVALEQA